jgi:hypothetical protein
MRGSIKIFVLALLVLCALTAGAFAGHHYERSAARTPRVIVVEKHRPAPPPRGVVVEKKTVERRVDSETRTFGAVLIMLGGFLLL